jgi:hypothetical protein
MWNVSSVLRRNSVRYGEEDEFYSVIDTGCRVILEHLWILFSAPGVYVFVGN